VQVLHQVLIQSYQQVVEGVVQRVVLQVHQQDQVIQEDQVVGVHHKLLVQEVQEIHHQQTLLKVTMVQQELMRHLTLEVEVVEVLVPQERKEHLQE
jgi:hypothetical protein